MAGSFMAPSFISRVDADKLLAFNEYVFKVTLRYLELERQSTSEKTLVLGL